MNNSAKVLLIGIGAICLSCSSSAGPSQAPVTWTPPSVGTTYTYFLTEFAKDDSLVVKDTESIVYSVASVSPSTDSAGTVVSLQPQTEGSLVRYSSSGNVAFGSPNALGNTKWVEYPTSGGVISDPVRDTSDQTGTHYMKSDQRVYEGVSTLDLPAGRYSAILVRDVSQSLTTTKDGAKSGGYDTTRIWFVPSIGYFGKMIKSMTSVAGSRVTDTISLVSVRP